MFGLTEEQISEFGMTFGIGAFMLFMLFIIGEIAWKSKAGKTGTMSGVRADSGVLTTPKGTFVFAIFADRIPGGGSLAANNAMGEIAREIVGPNLATAEAGFQAIVEQLRAWTHAA